MTTETVRPIVGAYQLNRIQSEGRSALARDLSSGYGRRLVTLPTGSGKTILAGALAHQYQPFLMTVHLEELLHQTVATLEACGINGVNVIRGSGRRFEAPVSVSLMQTLHARLATLPRDYYKMIVVDECHYAMSRTWLLVLERLNPAMLVGLTATPETPSGNADLSELFDGVSYAVTIRDAVREGLLVVPLGLNIRTGLTLKRVRVKGGDFDDSSLAAAVDIPERNALIVRKYLEHGRNRRAICFAAGIQHARHLAGDFSAAGVLADWVSGDDPQRHKKIADLKSGKLELLTNASLLTTGFDCKEVSCVIVARPTRSRTLFVQMAGRALRLAPGKRDALIMTFEEDDDPSLCVAWDVLGERKGVRTSHNRAVNLLSAIDERDLRFELAQRTLGRIWGTGAQMTLYEQKCDLLKPPPEGIFELSGLEWRRQPATERQLETLRTAGLETEAEFWNRGQASKRIGELPASVAQLRLLVAKNYDPGFQWSLGSASLALKQSENVEPNWSALRR